MFEDTKPDAVLHLAARVGGIKDNAENPAAYYHDNVMINTNVVHQAHLHGVERLLAALSTCAYPDRVEKYPFTEDDFLKGPPAETNLSYGYSKRMLHIQCQAYRKQHGLNYSTFCPSNIYGSGDHYNTTSSHFVAALISKVAPLEDGDTLELWGSGLPLRQQLYVDDLCELIPMLIEKHNSDLPLIVAPDENLSINEMTTALITQLHKNVKVVYNSTLDGQFRKDGSNQKLKELIGNYNFTKFKDGIMRTYNSYRDEM
jgi:GDP-L-fucose synthase